MNTHDEEITISLHFDNVSFSFKTDTKGSSVKHYANLIKKIRDEHATLFNSIASKTVAKTRVPRVVHETRRSQGRAETSLILQKLGEGFLDSDYFASPKTTGDVRSELKKRTGILFTPRKISQALGVLYKKGQLDRIGAKFNFQYIQRTTKP